MRSVFFFFIFFYIHLIAILHLATNILVPHSIQSAVCVCRDPLYLAPRACRRRSADDDYDAPDEEERRPIDFSHQGHRCGAFRHSSGWMAGYRIPLGFIHITTMRRFANEPLS